MAKHHNPKVVTTNLLLNLDFKNSKRFSTNLGTNLVQDPTYNASTWGTFATYKTTGIDAPDGSKNAVRMTSIVRYATYTLTTNVVTITIQAHGFTTGQNHYFDFTSGTGVDGYYNVTVVDANTFTIPVTATNGSGNVTVYGRTGLRVTFTPFTPNGTDTYTMSFWARLVSGTYIKPGDSILCDFNDGTQKNYTNELVLGKWVYITHSVVPTATSKSYVDLLSDTFTDYVIDFWGVKLENQTTDVAPLLFKDNANNITLNVCRPAYTTLTDSTISFTRTTSPASKWGGLAYLTATGNLTLQNFMYNDHTWEIWFKIDDINPGVYTGNEAVSILAVYPGYHQGYMYDTSSSTLQYYLWDNTTGTPAGTIGASWTLGTSGAQINQNTWYQVAVVKSGLTYIPYVNGVQLGTGYTKTTMAYNNIYNAGTINLGAAAQVAAGVGNYVYYSKNTVSNMKMYNRALSAAEIKQNFNALRGRFGI